MKLKKEHGYIALIILIVLISGLLLFYPEGVEKVIGYTYPYSYINIVNKVQQVEANNSELLQNENHINARIIDLADIKILEADKDAEALEIRKTIKESDFEFNIASILISLEQRAYENGVNLEIAYSSIIHSNSPDDIYNSNEGVTEDTENTDEPKENEEEMSVEEMAELDEEPEDKKLISTQIKEKAKEVITIKDKTKNEETDEEAEEEDSDKFIPSEALMAGAINIEGVEVVSIPIHIEGTYHNVRNYIKYLDKIGMIEPSSVNLHSSGPLISGELMLNVFHGEVGL